MLNVIGRLVDDRAHVTDVMWAATGRPQAGLTGRVQVESMPVTSMTTGALARVRGDLADGGDTAALSVAAQVTVRDEDARLQASTAAERIAAADELHRRHRATSLRPDRTHGHANVDTTIGHAVSDDAFRHTGGGHRSR